MKSQISPGVPSGGTGDGFSQMAIERERKLRAASKGWMAVSASSVITPTDHTSLAQP
jgi:hypothetical protein